MQNGTTLNVTSTMNSTMLNTTMHLNSTTCQLSPHGRALSSVLTAFVGSVIGGASGGFFVAFFTGWVSWLPSLRILYVAIYYVFTALSLRPIEGGDQFHDFWEHLPVLNRLARGARSFDSPSFNHDATDEGPTVLGWASWIWATCYMPVSQVLWILGNMDSASVGLKFARGLGIAVNALPLTIDTKARYGMQLERRFGCPVLNRLFNLMTATSCLVLGLASTLLLATAAIEARAWIGIAVYVFFMMFWTKISFHLIIPHDNARSREVVAGIGMGLFSGVFVAAPAALVLAGSPRSHGMELGDYVRCQPLAMWRKFVAMFP